VRINKLASTNLPRLRIMASFAVMRTPLREDGEAHTIAIHDAVINNAGDLQLHIKPSFR